MRKVREALTRDHARVARLHHSTVFKKDSFHSFGIRVVKVTHTNQETISSSHLVLDLRNFVLYRQFLGFLIRLNSKKNQKRAVEGIAAIRATKQPVLGEVKQL